MLYYYYIIAIGDSMFLFFSMFLMYVQNLKREKKLWVPSFHLLFKFPRIKGRIFCYENESLRLKIKELYKRTKWVSRRSPPLFCQSSLGLSRQSLIPQLEYYLAIKKKKLLPFATV